MSKIALVVGHNAAAQGAVRATDGRTEFDWCGGLAAAILACQPGQYRVFRRPAGLGYGAEIRAAYAAVDAWGADASLELHFNGGVDGATGTETLTSGSARSRILAGHVQTGMCGALGLRDRGIITRARVDRGGASLFASRAPAVLIEPYFGSNRSDCAAADRNFQALARAIHGACCAFLREV